MNVNVDRGVTPKAEVQPWIIAGIKTALAQDALRLCLSCVMNENASPNGASIGFHTFEFHLQPVRLSTNVVAQKRGRLVHIHDQNVYIAIVVKVAEGAPSTAVHCRHPRTGSLDQFFEALIAQITENHARSPVGVLWELS